MSNTQIITKVLMALLFASLYSCDSEKYRIRKLFEEFEHSQIEIPCDMTIIRDGKVLQNQTYAEGLLFIVYVGPEECSSCKVAHLTDFDALFKLGEGSVPFSVMIILSPPPDDIRSVMEQLIISRYYYPVYIDTNSEFANSNRIPSDPIFHSFLLNEEHRPIFVGNPLTTQKMSLLFDDVLSKTINLN